MRKTTAANRRGFYYKYYHIDDTHSLAVPAGRCRCGRITDIYCSKCQSYLCENHVYTYREEVFCASCRPEGSRELGPKEKRKIRKAKLQLP